MPKVADAGPDLEYLFGSDAHKVARLDRRFDLIVTEPDFVTALEMTVALVPALQASLQRLVDSRQSISLDHVQSQVPGLVLQPMVAGQPVRVLLDNEAWLAAAARTDGEMDDRYARAAIRAHGDIGRFGPATWADSGCVRFGGGVHVDVLKSLDGIDASEHLHVARLADALRDVTVASIGEPFCSDQAAGQRKELEAILAQVALDEEQRKHVEARLADL